MNASRDVLILEQMLDGRRRGSTAWCLVLGVTNQRGLLNNIHRFVRKFTGEEIARVGDLMKRTRFSGRKT
jgi:hypothetical protein